MPSPIHPFWIVVFIILLAFAAFGLAWHWVEDWMDKRRGE